jgi:hypothetical protein
MKPRQQATLLLIFGAGALVSANSAAQAQDTVPTTCPGFREMAEAAVPQAVGDRDLMGRLLAVKVSPQLSQTFAPRALGRAVGDPLRSDPDCRPTGCVLRGAGSGSLLQFKLSAGRAVYLNPDRRFLAAAGLDNQVSEAQATRATREALSALGLPFSELGRIDVRPLMAAAQDTLLLTRTQVLRAEVHVNLTRQVEGTRVFASRAVAAIGRDGHVARLYVQWPDFAIVPGLRPENTRPRPAVVAELLEKVSADNPCGTVARVLAHIAYVPASLLEPSGEDDGDHGEKTAGFAPGLVVTVVPPEARETPGQIALGEQQLLLPLLATPPQ